MRRVMNRTRATGFTATVPSMAMLSMALLAALLCCIPSVLHADNAPRPNVLFIAVDDLNDWIEGLSGHPQSRTPNLNRLARKGVLFTNAHTAAPACNPSRAALMTGIPPYRSGVYHNSQPWRPALPEAETIPQTFRKFGYWVAGSGKIFHGRFPDPRSWDEYAPSKTQQKFPDPRPPKLNLNGLKRAHFDWGPLSGVSDSAMGDAKTADWICGQLGRKHDRPFFLACGFYRPHLPWYVPEPHFKKFPLPSVKLPDVKENDLEDIPRAGRRIANPGGDHRAVVAGGQWKQGVQGYLASIAFVDRQIGRVLDALERGPNAGNTIVVLWSDHGWHLGEKEHWRKFTLWEEATRVPLVFIVPKGLPSLAAGTPAGKRCAAPASLMDLYPTLLELCGLPAKDGIAGLSLVPWLKDPASDRAAPVVTTHGRGNHAVRDARWRYIRYADGSEELYDHERDPNEWTNLAGDSKYASMKERLAKWLPKENAPDAERVRPRKKKKRARPKRRA